MKSTTSVYHLFRPVSEANAISLARAGAADGADGNCFELTFLPPEARTVDVFRRILAATPLPSIFCDYRGDQFLAGDDEARMEFLLRAAEAGADYVDVMGDLYAPAPDQLSHTPESIARQRQAIAAVHERGAKAIVSSHVPEHAMSAAAIVAHLQAEAERGADVCKLVSLMPTAEDYVEGVRAMARLRADFDRPWIFLGSGAFGRLQRFTGPSFGCAIEFGVHGYLPDSTYDQPTIRSLRQSLAAVAWEAPGKAHALEALARTFTA